MSACLAEALLRKQEREELSVKEGFPVVIIVKLI